MNFKTKIAMAALAATSTLGLTFAGVANSNADKAEKMQKEAEKKQKETEQAYINFVGSTLGTCQAQAEWLENFWQVKDKTAEEIPYEIILATAGTSANDWLMHCGDMIPEKEAQIAQILKDSDAALTAAEEAYRNPKKK